MFVRPHKVYDVLGDQIGHSAIWMSIEKCQPPGVLLIREIDIYYSTSSVFKKLPIMARPRLAAFKKQRDKHPRSRRRECFHLD